MSSGSKKPGDMVRYVNASDYEEFGPLGLGLIIQVVPANDGIVTSAYVLWSSDDREVLTREALFSLRVVSE